MEIWFKSLTSFFFFSSNKKTHVIVLESDEEDNSGRVTDSMQREVCSDSSDSVISESDNDDAPSPLQNPTVEVPVSQHTPSLPSHYHTTGMIRNEGGKLVSSTPTEIEAAPGMWNNDTSQIIMTDDNLDSPKASSVDTTINIIDVDSDLSPDIRKDHKDGFASWRESQNGLKTKKKFS